MVNLFLFPALLLLSAAHTQEHAFSLGRVITNGQVFEEMFTGAIPKNWGPRSVLKQWCSEAMKQ